MRVLKHTILYYKLYSFSLPPPRRHIHLIWLFVISVLYKKNRRRNDEEEEEEEKRRRNEEEKRRICDYWFDYKRFYTITARGEIRINSFS